MIQKITHTTIYVLDQEKALKFYTETLGFEVRADFKMDGGFRWLTVAPKGQDIEIILMEPKPGPMLDEESAKQVRSLLEKGALGGGVFGTSDCQSTYAELKEKGVEFAYPPKDEFYGIETLMKDDSGTWFSLCQQKNDY